jgi:hypothetical protein
MKASLGEMGLHLSAAQFRHRAPAGPRAAVAFVYITVLKTLKLRSGDASKTKKKRGRFYNT